MKTLAAVLVLVVAASSFGAVVTFNNPTVNKGTPSVNLTVTVTSPATFGAIDVIMQSAALDLSGTWTPAIAWDAAVDNGNLGMTGAANERWVGGAMTSVSRYVGPTVLVGTLTVPTANLAPGVYTVSVDGNADTLSAVGLLAGSDVLTGSGTVTVLVPEPATMALLALGGLLVARRRHA